MMATKERIKAKQTKQEKAEAEMRARVQKRRERPRLVREARKRRERERNPPRKPGQVLPKGMERPDIQIVNVSARKQVIDELTRRVPPEDARVDWAEGMSMRTGLPIEEVTGILTTFTGAASSTKRVLSLPHEVAQATARAIGASLPRALQVLLDAMQAVKLVSVGGELVPVPDHKVRTEAAKTFADIYGAKAPVTNKIEHRLVDDLSQLSDEELEQREKELSDRARKLTLVVGGGNG